VERKAFFGTLRHWTCCELEGGAWERDLWSCCLIGKERMEDSWKCQDSSYLPKDGNITQTDDKASCKEYPNGTWLAELMGRDGGVRHEPIEAFLL